MRELHLTYAAIGTLIGLFMLPGLFLAIPAGLAGRHASDRILSASGLATLAIAGAIAATADGFVQLAAARLIGGVGFVLVSLYFTKMVADWFAGREIATAMAVLVMSWPFGIAMGQVGHAWLAVHQGWRWPFGAAGSTASSSRRWSSCSIVRRPRRVARLQRRRCASPAANGR